MVVLKHQVSKDHGYKPQCRQFDYIFISPNYFPLGFKRQRWQFKNIFISQCLS